MAPPNISRKRTSKSWHASTLNAGWEGLYNSEAEADADIEAYKAAILQEDDTIIGERSSKVLQPQVSFVIMDQKTGQVKAISGGRGTKTASLTLNRATDTTRQPVPPSRSSPPLPRRWIPAALPWEAFITTRHSR